MEEFMNNEVMEEVTEMAMEPMASSGGHVGKIVVSLTAVAAGVIGGLLYRKNRDKIEERKIAKLRKKGYIVRKIEDGELVDVEDGIVDVLDEE